MVVTILGERRGRATMLMQLNAPAVEFDLLEPLLNARWGGAQGRCSWLDGSTMGDLDRTESFLTTVLGARKVYESGDNTFSLSRERFFLVGSEPGDADAPAPIWIAIMEGEPWRNRSSCPTLHAASRMDERVEIPVIPIALT